MKMAKEDAAKRKKKKSQKDDTLVEEDTSEGGGGQAKTVVVGVRMDSQSRELLTWALVKAAAPGDRVVALHILFSSASAAAVVKEAVVRDPCSQPAAVLSVAKELDTMLAVYEGFCNLKQIDLKLKICKGSSVRKILVNEARAFAASVLILGVNKNSRSMGSSPISVAKFCAKKLASNCSVVALSEGKTVFQREAADKKSPKKSTKHSIKVNDEESNELFCILPLAGRPRLDEGFRLSCVAADELNACSTSDENDTSTDHSSPRNNCSICAPVSDPALVSESKDQVSLASVPMEISEASQTSSMTVVVKDLPQGRTAWPSLRRLVLTGRKSVPSEKHKVPMIQWAKLLPNRSSPVHPDRKSKNSDGNVSLNLDGADSPRTPSLLTDAEEKLHEELESLQHKYSSVCRVFSHEEIMHATSNFSQDNLIGKGGSSSVYRGNHSDGKQLAVKLLKPSEDALKEFVSEIEIITTLHYRNIISLLGFCVEKNCLILVYDYFAHGSLEDILHGENDNKHVLNWLERYKVAIGVAEALDYLHGGGTEPVIHRDVKSSNILLSNNFEPQLSDFGFAKWASASTSQPMCNDVAGTFGYLAPEYILYGKVDEKIDVYAFGVVLLELLSGRKPICDSYPKGQESLVMWAKPMLQDGDVKQLLDPVLKEEFNSDQVERMILAAALCLRQLHHTRPQMTLVLKLLQGDDDATQWARSEVSSPADPLDDEMLNLEPDIRSHLNLALLDLEDDSNSMSSTDHTVDSLTVSTSVENYLQWRWSHSSSFD